MEIFLNVWVDGIENVKDGNRKIIDLISENEVLSKYAGAKYMSPNDNFFVITNYDGIKGNNHIGFAHKTTRSERCFSSLPVMSCQQFLDILETMGHKAKSVIIDTSISLTLHKL